MGGRLDGRLGGGVSGGRVGRGFVGDGRGGLGSLHRRGFHRVAGGLLHLLQPLRHDLGIAHALDLGFVGLQRHAHVGRVMLGDDGVVQMVVGRREQGAGDRAAVDDLEIALGRLDLHLGGVEEVAQMRLHDVRDGGVLGVEGHAVRHGDVERRGFHAGHGRRRALGRGRAAGAGRGLDALHHRDEALVFLHHRLGDVEQLEGAAGLADRVRQDLEAAVLGIKGDVEKRADVGTRLARRTAKITTLSAAAFATLEARTLAARTASRSTGAALAAAIPAFAARRTLSATRGRLGAGLALGRRSGRRAFKITPITARGAVATAAFAARTVITTITPGGATASGAALVLNPGGAEAEAL